MARSLQECLERINELKEETSGEEDRLETLENAHRYIGAIKEFYEDLKADRMSSMEALERIVNIDKKYGSENFPTEFDSEIKSYLVRALQLIAKRYAVDISLQGYQSI